MVGHPHPVLLRGAFPASADPERLSPTLLQLDAQDFVPRLLRDLKSEEGRGRLRSAVARERSDAAVLRLYQPVHRLHHVALVDVSCAQFGTPRLDTAHIEGAGVVIRRLDEHGKQLAWVRRDGVTLGWRPVTEVGRAPGEDYDPDPALRRTRRLGRNAPVLSRLATAEPASAEYEEEFTLLYPAPPEVAAASERTFLYGVLSPASSEREEETAPAAPPFTREDIRQRMPALLRAGDDEREGLPATGLTLTAASRTDARATTFFQALDYLTQEVGLFTDAPGTETLRSALDKIYFIDPAERLRERLIRGSEIPARKDLGPSLGSFLREAHDVLLGQPEGSGTTSSGTSITLPKAWPAIPASAKGREVLRKGSLPTVDEGDLVEGIRQAMAARWGKLSPARGRYGDPAARYEAVAFVRVRERADCPPRTLWTRATEPFEIVPWFETSGVPPVQVQLPEVNRAALSKLRPNVAFQVPPSVQKFMGKLKLGDLMDGKSEEGSAEWGMICGFNIPIITLCAFIVLQIFLALLNLLFWWLPFVKICIPFPKRS